MSLIKIPAVIKIPLYFQIRNKKSQNCLRLSLLNNKNKKLEKWRHCYQLFSDDSKSWLDCGSVKRELVSAQLFLGCKQGYWSISLGYWNSKVYMSRKVQDLYEEFFFLMMMMMKKFIYSNYRTQRTSIINKSMHKVYKNTEILASIGGSCQMIEFY